MPFQIVGERTLHSGFVEIKELDVQLVIDGASSWTRSFVSVAGKDSAGIVVVDPLAKTTLLIQQFRPVIHTSGNLTPFYEIPAGYIDTGELPHVAATRELKEETGLTAKALIPLGSFHTSPGILTEKIHLFCAEADLSGINESIRRGDSEWESVISRVIRLDEVDNMINSGQIPDCKSALGIKLVLSRY